METSHRSETFIRCHFQILNDPEAEKYVSGMAVHWYSWWLGPENLERTSKTFPDKFLLATEACNAWNPAFPEYWDRRGPHLGNWTYGEVTFNAYFVEKSKKLLLKSKKF